MSSPPQSNGSFEKIVAGSHSNRQGCRRRSTIIKIVVAFALNVFYHHNLDALLFFSLDRGPDQPVDAAAGFVPSWKFDPLIEPYMGNLTCMFEVAHHDLESKNHTPADLPIEKRRQCGKWRYRPHEGWAPPDPLVVFDKLPHRATIYFVGDSVSRQHFSDLACLLASVSKIVRVERNSEPAAVDRRGAYAGYGLVGATFRSYRGGTEARDVRVAFRDGNLGVIGNADQARKAFASKMGEGRKDDVFVLNAGLHYKSADRLVYHLERVKPTLLSAQERGARVVWRETNAAHFDGPDGYYAPEIHAAPQETKSVRCVPSSAINATASRERFNGRATPLMRSWGVHVLEAWEASFLMPEWCHVGGGVDCAHFLMPGGTSYLTEALLKYIEETM